ncbi:hypothetical protein HHI36_005126, partial [Cryptolaemus montrouzieri]
IWKTSMPFSFINLSCSSPKYSIWVHPMPVGLPPCWDHTNRGENVDSRKCGDPDLRMSVSKQPHADGSDPAAVVPPALPRHGPSRIRGDNCNETQQKGRSLLG